MHFEKLLNQLNQKFDSNTYATNFEDTEYLVILVIFYSIFKFKFEQSEKVDWLRFIFKMHNARSKDYFDFVTKNFSQEDLKE